MKHSSITLGSFARPWVFTGISQVTAPTEEPVTLAEAKLAAHITTTSDDNHINIVIPAATRQYEHETRRSTTTATYDYFLDSFPTDAIEIPLPPLASVTSVKYFDADGVEQTLAATVYDTDTSTEPGTIFLKPDQEWPEIQELKLRKAVAVRFVAGTIAADVSLQDKQAILFLVVHWLESREPVVVDDRMQAAEIPLTFRALVNARKISEVS